MDSNKNDSYLSLISRFLKMSEKDLERLGNRSVRRLKIPEYFLESKSTAKPPRISLKEIEPELPKNTARLHDFTDRTKLGRITFSNELILPEENSAATIWWIDEKYKGTLLFHLYSLEFLMPHKRLKNKTAFQLYLGIIREWDIKPGLYYAERNANPKTDVKCKYDSFCYSKGEDSICKRGGCWYHSGQSNDKENIWHVGVDFNRPIQK